MADDIDPLSAAFHSLGEDAIDVAAKGAATLFEVRDIVVAGRVEKPAHFPGFGSTEPVVMGRRIVAHFLDAGWRPPTDDEVAVAAERSRRNSDAFTTWFESLSEDEAARAKAFYLENNAWPDDLRPPPET